MTTLEPDIYREAFRETVNPAVIADTDLIITDVNGAACEFLGRSREELIGSTPQCLVNDESVYADIEATVRAGNAWVGEFESTAQNGRIVHGRGSITPLAVDGEVRGYVVVFTDTTSHRRYEESLRILNRVLRHNLRNDANVVLGHIERVADEMADRVDSQNMTNLVDSLSTAADRVENMLDRARTTRRFSGILAGEQGTLRRVDLTAAVEEAIDDVPTEHVEVAEEFSGPTPVLADEMVSSAIYAVVENAVEHNDKADPELTITTTERDDRIVLSIADNGPGIPQRRHNEIFGNGEYTQVEHGEGLSLFFVDRLMELYGGEVSVHANDPEGAVFDLHFRRPDADLDEHPTVGDATDADADGDADPTDGITDDIIDSARRLSRHVDRTPTGGDPTEQLGSPAARDRRSESDSYPPTDGVRANRARVSGSSGTRSSGDPTADHERDPGATKTRFDPLAFAGLPAFSGAPPATGDDPAVVTAAAALGESVTPARLCGDAPGFPDVLDAPSSSGQPHHLVRLRPTDTAADEDPLPRGTPAAAVFTDRAVVVVAGGDSGGRLSIPYASLVAVGREADALVLDAGTTTYRLPLSETRDDDAIEAAVTFLERELR